MTGEVAAVMRICRLLRIVRIFRVFRMLKQLYLLAYGFVEALQANLWVTVLCIVCPCVAAIVVMRIFKGFNVGQHDREEREVFVQEHFATIAVTMHTLFEFKAHPNVEEYRLPVVRSSSSPPSSSAPS